MLQSGQVAGAMQLDGLLSHLSSSSGLYSKATFLGLYSSIVRLLREQRMKGVVLSHTLHESAFETPL